MVSFADLAQEFLDNSTLQEIWGYRMPGAPADAYHHLLNLTACEALRGTGSDYYDWVDAANTINTWVLPFTGLLLQAPFDSNDAIGTFWAITRWVGGPMASLSYILWNMRSSANCAAFLDKATRRKDIPTAIVEDEKGNKVKSDYASYRDAFFLLSVMNQFTINLHFNGAAAEKLLKVALFSKELRLPSAAGGDLEEVRQALARDTREARKRGTVQCFLSQLWFIFSMVISIQQSFGLLGQDAPAENLALGLAMVWFPVLMLCTVVDRNPAIPEVTQRQLNTFLGLVREGLLHDAGVYRTNHDAIPPLARAASFDRVVSGARVKSITFTDVVPKGLSSGGPMIDEKEGSVRNWFDSKECDTPDLQWIDSIAAPALDNAEFFERFAGQGRLLWHYGVAYPILRGIRKDGFLDARRGWMYNSDIRQKLIATKRWDAKDRLHTWDLREFWQVFGSLIMVWTSVTSAVVIAYYTGTKGVGCRSLGYLLFGIFCTGTGAMEMGIWALTPHHLSNNKYYDRLRFGGFWFIRIAEMINCGWLTYIIFAQALGSYNTCRCQVSLYGLGGGYIDMDSITNPRPDSARPYWIIGTTLGCSVLCFGFTFIAWEWVTQSHMSTENYDNAMKGLRTTRRFKTWTRWLAPLQA